MFGPALLHLKRPQEFEQKAHSLLTKICISWIWSTTKILSAILKLKYFCIINLYVPIFSILYFISNSLIQLSLGDLMALKSSYKRKSAQDMFPTDKFIYSPCFFLWALIVWVSCELGPRIGYKFISNT